MTNWPPKKISIFIQQYKKILLLWGAIVVSILLLLYFGVDTKLIALLTLLLGLLTKAFAGLAAMISLIPIIGPLIVKLFAIPLFWILNALGYFVSVIAIKKGYAKEVVHSRILAIVLLVGILLGYILGHLLPIR